MDYNKIMAELDKEIFKSNSAFESAEGGVSTEDNYDEVEKELEEGLGVKGPYVEVEGEEDLVFDDGEGKAPEEEKENPKDLLVRAVNEYLTSLLDGGIEAEKAVEEIKELVESTLPKEEPAESEGTEESETDDSADENDSEGEADFEEDEVVSEEEAEEASEPEEPKSEMSAEESFQSSIEAKDAKILSKYTTLTRRSHNGSTLPANESAEEPELETWAVEKIAAESGRRKNAVESLIKEAIRKGVI